MHYKLRTPCNQCPFLIGSGFSYAQLLRYSSGEFACHKACDLVEIEEGVDEFHQKANNKTPHCAGALIFLEKQDRPHQMMRIAERIGMYDPTKLNMDASVVATRKDCKRKS